MMFKLLLRINLVLCLLASSTLAMEENKRKTVSSRPTTAQSMRGKSESEATTSTRFVRLPITVREKALKEEQANAAALAAKKAKQAQVAEAARRALTKSSQGGAGSLTARTTSSERPKTSGTLQLVKKTGTTPFQQGTGVLTAPPKPILRTKSAFVLQASKKSEAPKSVVWWDQESGGVVQIREPSLDVALARSTQKASFGSLSIPLLRMILRYLPRLNPQDPRDICRIARTSSTINRVIDEDHLLWKEIYTQNFPHHFFNAMKPAEKDTAIAQFKELLALTHGIDPKKPGTGYRKAFKFYLHMPEDKDERENFFYYYREDSRKYLPAVAILLRSTPLALCILEEPVSFGDRSLWSRAFMESSCFDEDADIYLQACARMSENDRKSLIQKGSLTARYIQAIGSELGLTRDMRQGRAFPQKELNALCKLNYFPALRDKLSDFVHGGVIYKQNWLFAAQEYERCTKLFHQNHEKLLKLKEVYTHSARPRNSDGALLWLKTPMPVVICKNRFDVLQDIFPFNIRRRFTGFFWIWNPTVFTPRYPIFFEGEDLGVLSFPG